MDEPPGHSHDRCERRLPERHGDGHGERRNAIPDSEWDAERQLFCKVLKTLETYA